MTVLQKSGTIQAYSNKLVKVNAGGQHDILIGAILLR